MKRVLLMFAVLGVVLARAEAPAPPLKQHGAFYSSERLAHIRQNLQQHPQGKAYIEQARARAAYWLNLPEEELWGLMFGPSITRSWMVWSNGDCPACHKSVEMYRWKIDARLHPWKVQCPHCREFFPKNDFGAFYKSGLNSAGLFEPGHANRALLFHAEHSEPSDPLRSFGVDDGEGFVQDGKRWRFIGAYLVYGQFKQLVRDGVQALASAWVFTGEREYARRAGILLDRVADVYPSFDYAAQGLVYERREPAGYVSVWHDACEETREMVLAYDQVFEALREDPGLVKFLNAQAERHGLPSHKRSFAEIQRNIESGILRDALAHPGKIHSNFPRAEITKAAIQSVLGWPENRAEVEAFIDGFIKTATAVDGVTGEKGLSGYSSFTISGLGSFLAEYARIEPDFLPRLLQRVPSLRQTYLFHLETHCLDQFYPNTGDCGSFAQPCPRYVGASFNPADTATLEPSMFTFFWQLYRATGDPAYVQILYRENGERTNGLPHDLFVENPENIREGVAAVIADKGTRPHLESVLKANWHLGILRSGEGKNERAVWLDYDAWGGHGHADGLTLGLFAFGRDLLPDFGYTAVQFGGWTTPEANWYHMTAAHNTVTVDGRNQVSGAGQCTLWGPGRQVKIMRASAPALAGVSQFERTVALVDVSPQSFYLVDLFRVAGGSDHARFIHGPFGRVTPVGPSLTATNAYGHGALLRNFRVEPQPKPGWAVTWQVADPPGAPARNDHVQMRYTDFSSDAAALLAEAHVMPYSAGPEGFWNPCVLVRRQGAAPLRSTFVGLLEAYEAAPAVKSCARRTVQNSPDDTVAVEMELEGGFKDLFLSRGAQAAGSVTNATAPTLVQPDWKLRSDAEVCWVRQKHSGPATRVALSRGHSLEFGDLKIDCAGTPEFVELELEPGQATVLTGAPNDIRSVTLGGRALKIHGRP